LALFPHICVASRNCHIGAAIGYTGPRTRRIGRDPLMDPIVFIAVLAAAACHAGWNTLLKFKLEPVMATSLVATASGLVAVPAVLITGIPALPSWPYVLASTAIHVAYYLTLAEAYRKGDLGQIYPIARGTAPLITAVLAGVVLHEVLGLYGWAGIVMLAVGILLLAFKGGRAPKVDARSVGFALATSLTITVYTIVDGLGARLSGAPAAYTAWMFLLSGAVMAVHGVLREGAHRLRPALIANWPLAIGGATLSIAAYTIAIWAMTVAPIALVAALRETGVLFAALFSTLVLREPLMPVRIVAALFVLAGAVLLRLA
jgi:drug/metabolite transporter (DMT)-like permease